jgi:hypothetical protein
MPIYRSTPVVANRPKATMHAFGFSNSPTAQPPTAPQMASPPSGALLAQGPGSDLTVTWTAPAADSTHDTAGGFNLQYCSSGSATWTTVSGVTSPYLLSGLAANTEIDVQLQSTNPAGTSAWSATSSSTTATAAPNTPSFVSLAQGPGSNLSVIWTTPATDDTHSAPTGFNLRSSPSGAATWTTVMDVASPYSLSGLPAGAAIDVQLDSSNAAGTSAWSAISTLTTSAGPYAPNAPVITGVAPPPDGTTTRLAVSWTAPAIDSVHGAATGYNLRTSPSGAGTWTTVTGVSSPYMLTGLTGAAALDVEIQATNAAASPGAWSAADTGTTWGATVVPGSWTAAATQVHGASVAPNGGVQMTLTPAPTTVIAAAVFWSTSASILPTAGLIAAATDGQTNGWGQYITAPPTAGTYYLWMLAQTVGGVIVGALVTSAITVS